MASSLTPNISKALSESDDLDTAVNRALYYEPVIHALKKYSSFGITEEDIAQTVEKSTGDGELYTNLLMEHQEALSTLASVNASESVEDQPMEIEILDTSKTPKYQSKAAAQHTSFTPKGKQKRVSYADMVKQNPKNDVSRPNSPSPAIDKKRKTAPVSNANNSRSPSKTYKKQTAAPSPKTISTVMTGYEPVNKDLIREIMVYDISSTWSQLDTLNHLKAWVK
ncbi:hypothetical protein RhiirA4_459220 [Rhizophagus irregularis]|uniref:Uncharacterized protein n=1 Tax=Rhizophagus irregularis TaxID=588596 RepID=A0A2I1GDV2_9GLOM|nr:hypothetical protein RhiirA4_459220 [Rhizophagus irregularis]